MSVYSNGDAMKTKVKLALQALKGAWLRRVLGPHAFGIVARTRNGVFAVDPEDFGVGRHLLRTGEYGLQELDRLKPLLQPTSRALVVGGHIGTLVVPLSRLCHSVVAFEPNPTSFELLRTNLALNRVDNCQVFPLAANHEKGTVRFLLSRANSGGSKRVPLVREFMYYYDRPQEVPVEAVRLDDFLAGQTFDVVIMDIEGSEFFALSGMQHLLSKARGLAVEFLPHHLRNVSGVTVEQFLSVIAPHFSWLTIPSRQLRVPRARFLEVLSEMYRQGQGDDGIIFEKGSAQA